MNDPQRAIEHLLYVYFENNDHIYTPYDRLAEMSRELLKHKNPTQDSLAQFIAEKAGLDLSKVHFRGSDYLLETLLEKLDEIHSGCPFNFGE